jgi:6-phosphogluconolactonase
MTLRTLDYGERGQIAVVSNTDTLALAAASAVLGLMTKAVSERGVATIALSGGSTPKAMGTLFLGEPFRSTMPWGSMHIFWGDERWVPLDDPESNAGEAKRGYLDELPVPPAQIYPFPTNGDPDQAAAIYADTIRSVVPGSPHPTFDLILLGMGDDGHTASLFPHTPALTIRDRITAPNSVEKLNTTRLTFTAPLINAARSVIFLVGGAGKADRLHEVLDGPIETDRLPSQLIRPTTGSIQWIVDEAAAAKLDRT